MTQQDHGAGLAAIAVPGNVGRQHLTAALLARHKPAVSLCVIIPCFNERANVGILAGRLAQALDGRAWEAVFVDDDSPDGTAAEIRRLAHADPRLRCVKRIGRRGLASAVIEGALSTSADTLVVIDGDLQHDETRIPAMVAALATCDVVVASRFAEGGDASGLANPWRQRVTGAGIGLASRLSAVRLTDPMSGFFAIRRDLFERLAPRLTGQGFKILLDLLLSAPEPLAVREIGAAFAARAEGESKLDLLVMFQFAGLLLDKLSGGRVPLRFVAFALVGAAGLLVHLAVLSAARAAGLNFQSAQILATAVAILGNFQLNNAITYRDMRLRGRALAVGLPLFVLVCGLGAAANIGIASLLYRGHSGWTPAGLAGAAIGLVWNYAVSTTLVWRPGQRA